MKYGTVQPTDIDAILQYKGLFYLICEVKYNGKDVPLGQRICLENMTDDFNIAGKEAMAIVADHYVDDEDEPVQLAECIVREYYWDGKWRVPKKQMTVKDAYDWAIVKWGGICGQQGYRENIRSNQIHTDERRGYIKSV